MVICQLMEKKNKWRPNWCQRMSQPMVASAWRSPVTSPLVCEATHQRERVKSVVEMTGLTNFHTPLRTVQTAPPRSPPYLFVLSEEQSIAAGLD